MMKNTMVRRMKCCNGHIKRKEKYTADHSAENDHQLKPVELTSGKD